MNVSIDTKEIKNQEDYQINIDSVSMTKTDKGILPAFVIVRCRWKDLPDKYQERTIHFWVIGLGSHELEYQTWDDHDGDGDWDIWGPDPPRHQEWIAFLFPIRHFTEWKSWRPDDGKAHVKVQYWIDGNSKTVNFYEP